MIDIPRTTVLKQLFCPWPHNHLIREDRACGGSLPVLIIIIVCQIGQFLDLFFLAVNLGLLVHHDPYRGHDVKKTRVRSCFEDPVTLGKGWASIG